MAEGSLSRSSPAASGEPIVMEAGEDDVVHMEPQPRLLAWRQIRGELCRRSVLTFTLAYSFVMLMQYNVGAFFSTQVTSVEREFGFSTLQAGQLMSANEIGYLCFILPFGYMASKLNVPRASTLACILVGFGGFLLGLPHFIFPHTPTHGNSSDGDASDIPPALCVAEPQMARGDRCDAVSSNSSQSSEDAGADVVYSERALPVLIYMCLIEVFRGAVSSIRFPMFSEFIESNTKKTDTGFYIGLYSALTALGPGITFIVGGAISKLHVTLQETDMTPTHPDWVGAWWLGFLIFGGLATVSPVALWCFPRRFKSPVNSEQNSRATSRKTSLTDDREDQRQQFSSENLQASQELSLGENNLRMIRDTSLENPEVPASDIPQNGVKEKSWLDDLQKARPTDFDNTETSQDREQDTNTDHSPSSLFKQTVENVKGFTRAVLRLLSTPAYLFLILATCLISFSMDGVLLFMPKYLQYQFNVPAWQANYIIGGGELTVGVGGLFVGGWLTRRLKLKMPGLYKGVIAGGSLSIVLIVILIFISCPQHHLVGTPGSSGELEANCSLSCNCPDEVFAICDRQANVNYFSACHAGCSELKDGVYTNCRCTSTGQAHPGFCPTDCYGVYFYCVIIYAILFLLAITAPVEYLIVIRCVPGSQTGLAIGTMTFSGGMIGLVIGPILFGDIIDSFCLHWNQPCGVQGECAVYDNDQFRLVTHLFSVVAMVLSVACFCFSFLAYSRQKKRAVKGGKSPGNGREGGEGKDVGCLDKMLKNPGDETGGK